MKLKKCLRKYPIPGCIAVALSVFVLLSTVTLLRKLFPDSTPADYAKQFVNVLWPLALTPLLGYGWCYRRGAFGKTLLAGLFAFILFSLTFLIRLGEALLDEETSWKTAAGICLGILNILGVGFREETKDIPVCMMSGTLSQELIAKVVKFGAVGCIEKPLQQMDMLRIIEGVKMGG